MTEFGKIDNPVDASFEAWPEDSGGLGKKASELALSFTGLAFTPARVLKILKDQFSNSSRFARIEYLFGGIRLQLKILESQIGNAREQMTAVQEKLETEQFSEATSVATEEAARTPSSKKIDQFAAVLVGSLTRDQWSDPNEDISVLIRDIAQLGEKDLRALTILRSVHSSAISTYPNLIDPDPFSRETPALKRAIASAGIHFDDFLSTCERLRGFGLAAEVVRNTTQLAPNEYCFRPTRRGLAVLDYLSTVSATGEAGTAKNDVNIS
jgi:hypothetical protein